MVLRHWQDLCLPSGIDPLRGGGSRASRSLNSKISRQRLHGPQNFGSVIGDFDSAPFATKKAARVDQKCGAFDAHVGLAVIPFFFPDTEHLAELSGFIREQFKTKSFFGFKVLVRLQAVARHALDNRVRRCELRVEAGEIMSLNRASWSRIFWVEINHDVFTVQRFRFDFESAGRRQRKFRDGHSNKNCGGSYWFRSRGFYDRRFLCSRLGFLGTFLRCGFRDLLRR